MVISPFPKTGCVRPPPSTANCSAGRGLCNNNHDFKNKSQISYLKQAGYLDRSTLDIWSDPWQYCRIGCLSLMIDQKARPNEHFFFTRWFHESISSTGPGSVSPPAKNLDWKMYVAEFGNWWFVITVSLTSAELVMNSTDDLFIWENNLRFKVCGGGVKG